MFSKIDLSRAYQQVVMVKDSREHLTLNTHKGLFAVNRLAFGVASAPAIFQKVMDNMLKGLKGVICYLDDILVMGQNEREHLDNLDSLLSRLQERGVRIKTEKCEFLKPELQFLGHVISKRGISATPEKVKAVLEAPVPINKKQLRAFTGMVTYYGKFLPELSTVLFPLNQLLCKNAPWDWSEQCDLAFKKAKELLVKAPVLAHYDPEA